MDKNSKFYLIIFICLFSCTSSKITKFPNIGNQILITQYSNFVLMKIVEKEIYENFPDLNDSTEGYLELKDIQMEFFNLNDSALVYIENFDYNVLNKDSNELKKIKVEYIEWEGVMSDSFIIAEYKVYLSSLDEGFRSEYFELRNREIINIDSLPQIRQ